MKNITFADRESHYAKARAWRPKLLWSLGMAALFAGAVGGGIAVADTPHNPVDIADVPVSTFANQDKPNVMLLMDTSDSMKWTHMPDDWDPKTYSATFFPVGYKSSLCNSLYYNPSLKYDLPAQPDGTLHVQPSFNAAWIDGYDPSKGTVNLSTNFQAYDISTRLRQESIYNDPAQAAYYFEWVPRVAGVQPSFEGADVTVGACNNVSNSAIKVDNGSLLLNQASANINTGSTTAPDGYWIRRGITTDAQQKNFATWYSFYRTRINMAKSSISLAFNSLDNNFRVGFLTAAKPDTSSFKFMPVKDFESTDKANWFQTIQSVKTGGSSPTREALARVGRYYANKSDSINSAMNPFADPVVSACQRHYAIVTTDGYWNVGQETQGKGPVQIDGTTLVGQQDGPDSDPAYNRPLTGPDGLTPRPIYDGSTSGSLLRRDASIGYAWNACGLGWQTIVPGGGTKTETTYKKITKKSVKTQAVTYGTVLGFYKSTLWTEQKAEKKTGFANSMRTYWNVAATKMVYQRTYKHRYTWNSITQSQYRNAMRTTWATEKQEPFGKAVYKRVEQKRYFYSYINQAIGEIPFKTTDKSVCEPYGCNLVGSDQWQLVNASCSPGMDGDYKVECQTSEVPTSASVCSNNGQFVPGQGTIYCEGTSGVSPINGPVPACGTLHPNLAASGVTASMVLFSGCDSSHSVTSYVTDAQCVNTGPVAPDFKKSDCAKETVGSAVNNFCTAGVSGSNVYTTCGPKVPTTQFVDSCPDLSNTATQMDKVCGAAEQNSSTAVPASSCVASTSPTIVTCEAPYTTSFGGGAVNPASCTGDTVCEMKYSDWGYAASCTPQSPSAGNNWTGVECSSGGGTCTPATGSPSSMVNGAVQSCTAAGPSPANGCFLVTCEGKTTDPVETTTCSTVPGPSASNGWVTTKCVANNQNNQPVQSCPQSGAVTDCNPQSSTTDMAYGSCVESGPTSGNGWTTTTCTQVEKVDYLSSAAAYAACTAGTAANGVETICEQEGPTTTTVSQGQACAAGYDPLTHKVTVCNVESSTTVFSADQPANCTAPSCTPVLGKKKVFSGSATTHRVNLLGSTEAAPQLISTVAIPVTNLESPAQCYSASEAAGMTLPANGRPQPTNTVVWGSLPAGHQSCTKLPCDTVEQSNVTGGSRNSLADVAQYYYGTDLRPAMANLVKPAGTGAEDDKATWQHMATYVIGMGVSGTLKFDKDYKNGAGDFAGIRNGTKTWPVWPAPGITNYEQPQSIDDFWHTAVNGRGLYFSANDPQAIKSGLGQVFSDIRAAVGSGAGVAVSSAVVETDNNYAYGALYRSGRWSGEVQAYEINVSSGVRSLIANWSARAKLDARDLASDDRRIYFMDGTTLKNFSWSALGSLQSHFNSTAAQALLSQYGQMSSSQQTAALGENLVKFLRGDRTKEGYAQGDDAKLYRSRDSRLGDIIGSQPLYVGKPQRKYRDAGYAAFRLAQKSRRPMVYVGGNDGMLHAFYADVDLTKQETIGGKSVYPAAREAWAFVPKAVMPAMPALASNNYDGNHRYFVDGSPVTADIFHDGAWKTILVGGFNKGGNGYYALDITDPETPKALWEASAAGMGQSYGKPLITKMPDGTWVALLTSGFNNADGKGYVYVLNAGTGAVIQTITNPDGAGMKDLNNFMKDPSGNNTSTLFYGGDIQGNIWRYQWISGSYQAKKVVQLKDDGGNEQPITTRLELVQSPNVSALPRILVATGKLLGLGDLSTTGKQTIYGIDDVADGYSNSGLSFRAGLKQSELKNVTTGGKLTRTLQCASTVSDAVCNDATKSWFVDLPDVGERVNVDLRLANTTLVVASNVPSTEPCVAGGKGWINYLDFQTGRAVNTTTGMAGEAVDGLISGNDLSANQNGDVTSHVSPSQVPENPIDIRIPVATPKPLGKRISWRELVNK